MDDGNTDHVHVNVGIGAAPISIGSGFSVIVGLFQILFFDDLLALDHTAAAIGALVLAFYAPGAAAGAGLIIFDLGADDLLFGGIFSGASDTEPFADPADEPDDRDDGKHKEEDQHEQAAENGEPVVVFLYISSVSSGTAAVSLAVFRESKGVVGIGYSDRVAITRRK